MSEDSRLLAAREHADDLRDDLVYAHTVRVLDGLLAYAEERLKVNVGLLAENTDLKKFDSVAILNEQAEDQAIGSRDFGRGYAQAIKVLETARKGGKK